MEGGNYENIDVAWYRKRNGGFNETYGILPGKPKKGGEPTPEEIAQRVIDDTKRKIETNVKPSLFVITVILLLIIALLYYLYCNYTCYPFEGIWQGELYGVPAKVNIKHNIYLNRATIYSLDYEPLPADIYNDVIIVPWSKGKMVGTQIQWEDGTVWNKEFKINY